MVGLHLTVPGAAASGFTFGRVASTGDITLIHASDSVVGRSGRTSRIGRLGFRVLALAATLVIVLAEAASAQNAIVTENQRPGAPQSTWDITGSGDATIQGFATDISVNKGTTVHFKIDTNAAAYTIQIYRLGYYQGNGARLVGSGVITAALPQNQPDPLTDTAIGLVDCGNWAESAHWDVPATAVSGIYIARLKRTDTGGASHIAFIVRDDASHSDLLFQTSDGTWQAYNVYGGNSLYVGNTSLPSGHAAKVSYNRPFLTRAGGGGSGEAGQDWLFNAEYPMVRWLEANGFDVTYSTDVDSDRNGQLIMNHKVFMSVGHDEYWSAAQRANVETARNAGVHLAFFSGNEIYWKTRYENSTDGTATPYRTLVCYKEGTLGENACGGKCDPLAVWTGLWRDGCAFTPPADGCRPENALSAEISWDGTTGTPQVPAAYKNLRFWRNTSVASLGANQTASLAPNSLGYEWDFEQYRASYPSGRILLSSTLLDGRTHHLTMYRYPSGALVFGAGTVQWSWGLDGTHDRGGSTPNTAMRQATVNLLADMGVQPGSLQSGLVAATASTDVTPPTTTITSPTNGDSVGFGSSVTISGTASDAGGGQLVGVEASVDGGTTWQAVNGTSSWTYTWIPSTSGTIVIESRGWDDSGNMQIAGSPPAANAISVIVSPRAGGSGSFPQTPVLDAFDRAAGSIGGAWVDGTADYSISSNALAPDGNVASVEWNGATFGANQEAYVTLSATSPLADEQNLMLETQGTTWSSGHIEVSYSAVNSTVTVSTFTPPSNWQAFATIGGVAFAAGDQFGARALSDGTVEVYKNGALLGTTSVSGWVFTGMGGLIGLSSAQAADTRFDDFGGGTYVPTTGVPTDSPSSGALWLSRAVPNPTQGGASFELHLPREASVRMSVLDILGREVWSERGRRYAAGTRTLRWDGHGARRPGVYLAVVRVDTQTLVRWVTVVH